MRHFWSLTQPRDSSEIWKTYFMNIWQMCDIICVSLTWFTLSLYSSSCLCSLKRPRMIISLSCPVLTLLASSSSLFLDFREYWCLFCVPWFSVNEEINTSKYVDSWIFSYLWVDLLRQIRQNYRSNWWNLINKQMINHF